MSMSSKGQHVDVGDKLFEIDPAPYRIALALAKGRLEAAKVDYHNLRISYKSNEDQIKMGAGRGQGPPVRL